MKPVTAIEQIDFVLNAFYSKGNITDNDIVSIQEKGKIADDIFKAILYKLKDDNYIITESAMFISFEGRLFKEFGGYTAKALKADIDAKMIQLEDERHRLVEARLVANSKRLNTLTLWLAVGTGFLALIEILKFCLSPFS